MMENNKIKRLKPKVKPKLKFSQILINDLEKPREKQTEINQEFEIEKQTEFKKQIENKNVVKINGLKENEMNRINKIKENEMNRINKIKENEMNRINEIKQNEIEDKKPNEEQKGDNFEELGLCPQLVQACKDIKFQKPTEIQQQAIPHALKGRDIIGLAQTGSGKTAAFVLPILQFLLETPEPYFACIISPTRELAFQISEQVRALGANILVKCAVLVGGIDMVSQAIALAKKPHIIVATPGRLSDHLENTKGFNLRNLKVLVLDEADKLLNMDFQESLTKILKMIPKNRKTYLYSATMTSSVEKLQRASLINPVKVEVCEKYSTVDTLIQQYVFIPNKYRETYIVYILNELVGNSIIIFSTKCQSVQKIALILRNLGFKAVPLHGKMTQTKRLASLNKFVSGNADILIATDVASRGLDIPNVDIVINFDIPVTVKTYIHRVGRTARAGKSGRAINIVTQYDVEFFQKVESGLGFKMKEYTLQENLVLSLYERVLEAEKHANKELKEQNLSRKRQNRSKKFTKSNQK
ncbi:hypothetical protein M0811_05515 [Anaeramoeba ignava]|uniref:Uncharacterized protein n=1 Tax=Anaeramoeba ignava TaxID=1746090 RepID=A0A9Q0LV33_ANAIG|nr:hypothetical protein M0811_05515 [Anaeramoeba ignava]